MRARLWPGGVPTRANHERCRASAGRDTPLPPESSLRALIVMASHRDRLLPAGGAGPLARELAGWWPLPRGSLRREDHVVRSEPPQPGGALERALERRGEADRPRRGEIRDGAEMRAEQELSARGAQAGDDLRFADQSLLTGVLGDAGHQPPPVWVAGIVVPNDHPTRGLHDPDHLGERLSYLVGVGDVVHDGDGDHELEAVVIEGQRGSGRVHRADHWRPRLEDLEHSL